MWSGARAHSRAVSGLSVAFITAAKAAVTCGPRSSSGGCEQSQAKSTRLAAVGADRRSRRELVCAGTALRSSVLSIVSIDLGNAPSATELAQVSEMPFAARACPVV